MTHKIDSAAFRQALEQAAAHIAAAFELVSPFLVVLTEDERASTPRTRSGFLEAVQKLLVAVVDHPQVAAVAGLDPQGSGERADHVTRLISVEIKLGELLQRVQDSRLVWLAELLEPSLVAYGVAKSLARKDGALRTVVQAIAPMFALSPDTKEKIRRLAAERRVARQNGREKGGSSNAD
jgi:hypothetical protein